MVQDFSWVPTGAGGAMGGRNIVSLLLNEARTKPVIADLVARAADMTEAEFSAVATPLPWQKKALGELRKHKAAQEAAAAAGVHVEAMGGFTEHKAPSGHVVRHTGPDVFWKPPKKNRMGEDSLAMLIKTGDLMFVTPQETWLGATSVGFPNIPCEIVERDVERSRYFELQSRDAPAIPEEPAARRHGGMFTITRH